MNWGNKRRRKARYSGSLKSVTVNYYSSALGAVRRLPCRLLTQSMAAESLYPGQAGKEDRRGIGKHRQEDQQERKGEGLGLHLDFNGLTWMLLIAATPMYRKMP